MKEWNICKVKDLAIMKNGKKRPNTIGHYPVYGGNGIMDYCNTYNNENTIIIGRVGAYCGNVFYCKGKCWVSDNAIALCANSNNDITYLYYLLTSLDLHHNHIGGAQPLMTQDIIGNFDVCVPELETQIQIANILSSVDKKIELNRQINDNLEQQAQAIYKSWFMDNFQAHWQETSLADVTCKITDGVHNTVIDCPDGEYFLLSCKNIKNGTLDISSTERKINRETFNKLRKRTQLGKGDILLTSVGTIGELMLLNEDPYNFEFQRSVAIIKPNENFISSFFLYGTLKSQIDKIKNTAHGAVQQCIFLSDLKEYSIYIPEFELISQYDQIVKPLFDEKVKREKEIKRLTALRDTLLPKLMSGELKINKIDC